MQEKQVTIGDTVQATATIFSYGDSKPSGTRGNVSRSTSRQVYVENCYRLSILKTSKICKTKFRFKTNFYQACSHNEQIITAQQTVREVYMDEKIERYILDLVFATVS